VWRFPDKLGVIPVGVLVAALVASDAVWADGPWNGKPRGNWDRADVHRILFDSPWVRRFRRTKRDLEFEVPDQGPSNMELRGYHAKESQEDGAETAEFYIRWVSSRTLRAALAQGLALRKPAPANPAPANPVPANPAQTDSPALLDEFEVAIAGPDMSLFERTREAALRSRCYLWVSSKRKIPASRVEFARSSTGQVRGLLFRFPRKTADGEPLISTHDTKVWFIESGGDVAIRVSFELQAMVDVNGPDL
jgi:hypothetical protein